MLWVSDKVIFSPHRKIYSCEPIAQYKVVRQVAEVIGRIERKGFKLIGLKMQVRILDELTYITATAVVPTCVWPIRAFTSPDTRTILVAQ